MLSMAELAGCAAQRVGAAKRRKDGQVRAFRRHELLTVRMELAAASTTALDGWRAERGGRARDAPRPTGTEDPASAAAACQPVRAAGAAGARTEAHRGAACRLRSHCADPRCSCAAVGGPVVGSPQVLCHAACCCRAGYRSAQDHS